MKSIFQLIKNSEHCYHEIILIFQMHERNFCFFHTVEHSYLVRTSIAKMSCMISLVNFSIYWFKKAKKRFIIFVVLDPWIFVMFQGWDLFVWNFKNYVNINQDISFLGKTKMHPVHKISKLLLQKQKSLFQSSIVDHSTYSKFEFNKKITFYIKLILCLIL